ncbi:MAG: peptide-methionine (S)-S-oxide reductase MsrA [Candidatus Sericytochromatia bacterium]
MIETITLGAGCFWCVEAIFQRLKGVKKVESGYMGGNTINPTYKQVCTGETGHAEVLKVEFDNEIISLENILEVFWHTHDPTTLNKQGADEGTQYRSAVFYYNQTQKDLAEKLKNEYQKDFNNKIVTEITAVSTFYKAEDYHQNYFNDNSFQPYCNFVISPKLKKLQEKFSKYI